MGEGAIQDRLYRFAWHKGHRLVAPNLYVFGGCESDMISVNRGGLISEYEVKISRSDYKADFKKARHQHMVCRCGSPFVERTRWVHFNSPGRFRHSLGREWWDRVDYEPTGEITEELKLPSYFWFVTPEGLLKPEEIPPYAGLIEVGRLWPKEVIKAPKLHNIQPSAAQRNSIAVSLAAKYWDDRLHRRAREVAEAQAIPA